MAAARKRAILAVMHALHAGMTRFLSADDMCRQQLLVQGAWCEVDTDLHCVLESLRRWRDSANKTQVVPFGDLDAVARLGFTFGWKNGSELTDDGDGTH